MEEDASVRKTDLLTENGKEAEFEEETQAEDAKIEEDTSNNLTPEPEPQTSALIDLSEDKFREAYDQYSGDTQQSSENLDPLVHPLAPPLPQQSHVPAGTSLTSENIHLDEIPREEDEEERMFQQRLNRLSTMTQARLKRNQSRCPSCKTLLIVFVLLALGITFLALGIYTAIVKTFVTSILFFVIALIGLIPGIYHVVIIYRAFMGYPGYNYGQMSAYGM